MSIFLTCILSSKLISLPLIKSTKNVFPLHSSLLINPIHYNTCKKGAFSSLPSMAASISSPPIDVDYLNNEFSINGVSFTEIGDSCIVRMAMENGSLAKLMLPSGLVTSYKAQMWHGGVVELLHTTVSEGENGGGARVRGGMLLDVNLENDDGVSWSPDSWILHQVKETPGECIQVELISRDAEGVVEVRYIITLQQDMLSSEIIITNSSASSLRLMGSLISHLVVSTPEASYAIGLQGSDFVTRSPILTKFGIVPPDFGKTSNRDSKRSWNPMAFLSNRGSSDQPQAGEDLEGEEDDDYKHLTEEMSKIYTSAPQSFTIIDRGRRNSIIVGGDGFDELYMFSPGSSYQSYSEYSFVSIGHTSLLKPIDIKSQRKWRGGQQLCNPNL